MTELPRVWRDKEGTLWVEVTDGQLACLDASVLTRVAEKFGTDSRADVERSGYGPLVELRLIS